MVFCRRVAVLRRAALRTFLGGTVAAGLGGLRVLAAEKLPDTDTLSSLYAEAVEAKLAADTTFTIVRARCCT